MDRSQDNRSPEDASPRQNETDPWGEFLSESSEELLQLQSTHAGSNDTGADGGRHAGIRIVPLLEPNAPSSPADDFLHREATATSLPEEPPSVAAPAPPRDGAPPFTRRVSYGRTYESPLSPAAPLPGAQATSQDVNRPLSDAPLSSTLFQSTPVDETRPSLFNPEVPPAPPESIWKTPSSVPHDDLPAVATGDELPLVAARDDVPPLIERDVPTPVDHHPLPPVSEHDEMPPAVSALPEAAPRRSPGPPRAPATQGADSLLLGDLLERRTPVHWSEAVAVVEELCAAIEAGPSDTVQVPDLADVFITPDGLVGVRQGAAGEPDVAALGRALHSLIGTGETPLPLRLFVTSAVSADRFASVALFADALSYYALPDRVQLIQALYKRAMERRPALPVVTPRKPTVIPPPAPPPAPNRERMVKTWTMAAAAGLVVGAIVGVWLWSAGLSSEAAVTVPVKKVVPTSAPKRTEDWTPGPILIEGARPAVPPPARPDSRAQTPARTEAPLASTQATPIASAPLIPLNARPTPATTVLSPPQPAAVAAAPAAAPSPVLSSATTAAVFSSTPVAPPVAKAPVVVDSRTYSAADLDVDEPVLLTAKPVLPAPPSRRDPAVTRTFELVLDHEGRVQSSRLLEDNASFSDMALTQQLKLLRFRPATKDGRPVKYSYLLRLTSSPE